MARGFKETSLPPSREAEFFSPASPSPSTWQSSSLPCPSPPFPPGHLRRRKEKIWGEIPPRDGKEQKRAMDSLSALGIVGCFREMGEKREKTVRGIRNILHVHGRNLRFRRGARVPFPCENEDKSPTQNLAGKRINMAAGIFTILRHSEQRFELKNSEFYCEINF